MLSWTQVLIKLWLEWVLLILGILAKLKNVKKILYGIAKREVKTIGEITVNVQISPHHSVIHNVVVPDDYLSTDYLTGMDLLSHTNFFLIKKGDLKYFIWCGVKYPIVKAYYNKTYRVSRSVVKKSNCCRHVKLLHNSKLPENKLKFIVLRGL